MDKVLGSVLIFALFCDKSVVNSNSLPAKESALNLEKESLPQLAVQQLSTPDMLVSERNAHDKGPQDDLPNASKNVLNLNRMSKDLLPLNRYDDENSDTKRPYFLLKIREYYDFLPWFSSQDERRDKDRLLLEIDDVDDPSLLKQTDNDKSKHGDDRSLIKRETGDIQEFDDSESNIKKEGLSDILEEYKDVIQYFFVKRDVHASAVYNDNDEVRKQYAKRDLGNFAYEPEVSADSDDPDNNNYKYVAYVPFFKVTKYYIHRKNLDFGL